MRVKLKTFVEQNALGNLGEPSQKGALMGAFVSRKNALIRELKAFASKFERTKFKNKRIKNFDLGIPPPPYFSFSR